MNMDAVVGKDLPPETGPPPAIRSGIGLLLFSLSAVVLYGINIVIIASNKAQAQSDEGLPKQLVASYKREALVIGLAAPVVTCGMVMIVLGSVLVGRGGMTWLLTAAAGLGGIGLMFLAVRVSIVLVVLTGIFVVCSVFAVRRLRSEDAQVWFENRS